MKMISRIIKGIKLFFIRSFTMTYCQNCIHCSDSKSVTTAGCLAAPKPVVLEYLSKQDDAERLSKRTFYLCSSERNRSCFCSKYVPIVSD